MFVFPKFQTPNMYMITPVIKVNEFPPWAPFKPLTIRRKELLSALLTVRLITSARSALENFIAINSVNCWLDSRTALHWVTNNENECKPYIENRRQEIRKLVDPISFNYCPTKENPADHTTRGFPLSKLA